MKLGFSEPKLLVMDSITEPVTSGSELEEGEIDDGENNDIEIISERIVKVPMVAYKRAGVAAVSPIRKRSDWEDVLVDLKSKRMKSSCEITPELPHKFQESVLPERSHRQQRLGSHSEQPSDTHKNYQSRNQHKNSNTSRRHADLKKKLKSSPKSQNQNNRFKTSPPNSPRVSVAERDPNDKKAPTKSGLSEANIKIKENDKNDDTDDEEMELRLAALKSVVTKTTQTEKASDKPTSLPLVLEEPKKACYLEKQISLQYVLKPLNIQFYVLFFYRSIAKKMKTRNYSEHSY